MRPFRLMAIAASAALVAACAGQQTRFQPDADSLAGAMIRHDIALLGEVHDNAAGHGIRHEVLASALRSGWRPAIAMEQFDHERQPALDSALQRCADAECVIAAAGGGAWDWHFYKPVIALAMRHRLPLVAANLSRHDAARIVREGPASVFDAQAMAALGLAAGPPGPLLRLQAKEIEASHCGKLPAAMLEPMAIAQIVRDAVMAHAIRTAAAATGRPVVLLAGNGHVRKDAGVPYWLPYGTPQLPRAETLAMGIVESAAPDGLYDETVRVAPHVRPDPCLQFGNAAK